jgi:hypothetical protein
MPAWDLCLSPTVVFPSEACVPDNRGAPLAAADNRGPPSAVAILDNIGAPSLTLLVSLAPTHTIVSAERSHAAGLCRNAPGLPAFSPFDAM